MRVSRFQVTFGAYYELAKIIGSFSPLIVKPAFDVICFVLLLLLLLEFFFSVLLTECFNITLDWRLTVEVTNF